MKASEANQLKAYSDRIDEQIIGQLFFQDVTEVDQHKTTFEGVSITPFMPCCLPDAQQCVAVVVQLY